MTNLNKNTVEDKAEDLSKSAKSNIKTLSKNVKSTTNELAEDVVDQAEDGRDKAVSLIENIKSLVSVYSDPSKIDDIKSDVYNKARTLKESVSHDVSTTYKKGKKKTIKKVRQNPIGSVAVAAGVGAVLGYLIASKKK